MVARKLLIDQDWIKARNLFVKGLKQPGSLLFVWRTKSILDILFFIPCKDMDSFVSFLKKRQTNEQESVEPFP